MKCRSVLALLFALGVSGCCSGAKVEAAHRQRDELRAAIVADYDPDVPPAASCGDAPVVTYGDMKRGDRAGDLVAVDGIPMTGAERICTLMLCTDPCGGKLPCCNGCSSGLMLAVGGDLHARINLVGQGLGCSGYDCAMQCRPFGQKPGRSYRFVGRYTSRTNPNGYPWVKLTADRWCHAP